MGPVLRRAEVAPFLVALISAHLFFQGRNNASRAYRDSKQLLKWAPRLLRGVLYWLVATIDVLTFLPGRDGRLMFISVHGGTCETFMLETARNVGGKNFFVLFIYAFQA